MLPPLPSTVSRSGASERSDGGPMASTGSTQPDVSSSNPPDSTTDSGARDDGTTTQVVRIAYLAQHRRGLPELLKLLVASGFTTYRLDPSPQAYRSLRDNPPDLLLADLTLRSAHVREMLDTLSKSPFTRHIPLTVVGVAAEELPRARNTAPLAREFHMGPVTHKLLLSIVSRHLAPSEP